MKFLSIYSFCLISESFSKNMRRSTIAPKPDLLRQTARRFRFCQKLFRKLSHIRDPVTSTQFHPTKQDVFFVFRYICPFFPKLDRYILQKPFQRIWRYISSQTKTNRCTICIHIRPWTKTPSVLILF